MRQSSKNQTHIRFTEEEYSQILEDSTNYGDSIPSLIKSVYFGERPRRPICSAEDANRIIAALNRIGNNVNQIARKCNSGFREGFSPALDEIRDSMRTIRDFVLGTYGGCKN